MMKFMVGVALIGTTVAGTPAQAAAVTVGTADTGSAFPFGANAYLGGYYTQQIYSASSFAGPIRITGLTFFQTLYPGTANTGPYRISLGTTTFNDIANSTSTRRSPTSTRRTRRCSTVPCRRSRAARSASA